jgi:hypothetical protein
MANSNRLKRRRNVREVIWRFYGHGSLSQRWHMLRNTLPHFGINGGVDNRTELLGGHIYPSKAMNTILNTALFPENLEYERYLDERFRFIDGRHDDELLVAMDKR